MCIIVSSPSRQRGMSARWLIIATLLGSGTVMAQDCQLGREYLSRAQAQLAESHGSAAIPLLRQSIAACPSYDAYETLAERLAHSRNRRDWRSAADAFVEAHELAATPKARAQTLYEYASLVNDDGDPQNAYPMIKKAQALDPGRKDIATLAAAIEQQVRAPKKTQLERSFGLSVYRPLKATAMGGDPITGAGHRQVNIPINFEFDSVALNDKTRGNVTLLADAMAATPVGEKFVFIGHTDSRGDERYNLNLSRRRADTMRGEVVKLEPSLAGRIDVDGRGASEPIDSGTDLRAMQANRRLQVIVK
jgi:outer membrane protein OmpA-like peptidoglycan-associated protein